MEKEIGKINKNDTTDIVVRVDDFGGRVGVTVREYVTSERYTGFTKSGVRILADKFADFKAMINSIDEAELQAAVEQIAAGEAKKTESGVEPPAEQKADEGQQYL